MDGAQVCVFEKSNEVCLRALLEELGLLSLEAEIALEVLGNLAYKTLEGELADQQLGSSSDTCESHVEQQSQVCIYEAFSHHPFIRTQISPHL